MNKQPNLPSAEESQAHYGVPSGYFDTLEDRIMAQIPESQPEEALPVAKPKLWIRLRPIVYLAAIFVSMNLIFRAFHPDPAPQQVAKTETPQSSDDEYTDYYADYGERMTASEGYSTYYSELEDALSSPTATLTSY